MSNAKLLKQCQEEIAPHLQRLTKRCVAELRAIIKGKQPARTYLLMFEYDSMEFGREFPVMLWWMDRTGLDLRHKELLGDVKFTVPEEMLGRYESEDMDPDPYRLTGRLFIKWFTDCWQAAGGASCTLPGYLMHHDGGTPHDLKRRGKVSPEPVFPDA